MRRLYSTFAGGWPGIGLLLLRSVLGSALLIGAGSQLWGEPPLNTIITSSVLGASGILLIAGLWTPIAGTSVALLETWQMVIVAGDPWVPLLLGTMGGALALLGPGLWSVDARLFGWKRVEVPPRRVGSLS